MCCGVAAVLPAPLMADEDAAQEWLGGETGPEGRKRVLPDRVQDTLLVAYNDNRWTEDDMVTGTTSNQRSRHCGSNY